MRESISPPAVAVPLACLVVKAVSTCNLACGYCYMAANHARVGGRVMHRELAEAAVTAYARLADAGLGAGAEGRQATFLWHGGEPLLAGQAWFRAVLERQRAAFGDNGRVGNALTTNGVALDDAWCELLREHGVRVTVSLDGHEALHNAQRPDHAGAGSFGRAMRGFDRLRRAGLDPTAMLVVTERTVAEVNQVFEFIRAAGIRTVAFAPHVEAATRVSAEGLGRFLTRFFELWLAAGDIELQVRDFEVAVARLLGQDCQICEYGDRCGQYPSLDVDGDLYACDFFTGNPSRRLGALPRDSLEAMLRGSTLARHRGEARILPPTCQACRLGRVCGGGCLARRVTGEGSVDPLCEARKQLFNRVAVELGGGR